MAPFSTDSSVGVRGAEVILLSLLGPNDADPDLTRRCDIIFPLGDDTISEFDGETGAGGSEMVRWCGEENLEVDASVGVGGVFTITGAALSSRGGVCGLVVLMAGGALAVLGRSGVDGPETRSIRLP